MSIKSFFQLLFGLKKPEQPVEVIAPASRKPYRKHKWLLDQTKNVTSLGEYILRPPQDMDIRTAQILVNRRFHYLIGAGNYSTHRRRKGNHFFIQVIVRAIP